jgi:thiamine-phosphate pyrophosphorylase
MIHCFENFLFLENFNSDIEKKIIKNKIKNIIYYNFNISDYSYIKKIRQWCKKNKIKFFIINDYHLAKKLESDGIYISSNYKTKSYLFYNIKKFIVIGSAHNQLEYYFKKNQECKRIFLSPIFKTNKYSNNKILGLVRFNLISLNWAAKTVALGGIRINNIKLIKLTRNKAIGFKSLINEL